MVTNVKYYPTVYGIGYIGDGKYKSRNNGKHTTQYRYWHNMMNRCYGRICYKNPSKNRKYKDCSVCDEWINFQNFAKWFDENYYEIDGDKMCLDKDILRKGNKIYSPNSCVFVPNRINILFIKSDKLRGDLPIGLTYHKRDNKIDVYCNTNRNQEFLGRFNINEIEEAFNAYKQFKENYIKQVAEEYKDKIPKKLYEAMYKYEVEITD